ncbi:hypothetical protein CVT24_004007 [Panaeolus cyanescens]|uniref:TspO/MBR-related protein n=1 Tax=Panaeolus cyanescens TaxID=181874 RepID=A0A409Y659_9AGAR|nr:hypothetical protein CVT24_004007 [Panaeolus cyanescens]
MSVYIPNILLAIPRNPVTAVGLPIVLGFASGIHTTDASRSNWYYNLKTPKCNPPREVFPYVWTALYVSMGYASHIAVKALDNTAISANRHELSAGLALYYAQLGLNCLWSPLFFGAQRPGLALIDSVLLTATTWVMTKRWDRATNAKATYWLLPYCAWLAYATYLNAGTWWLNRNGKGSPRP